MAKYQSLFFHKTRLLKGLQITCIVFCFVLSGCLSQQTPRDVQVIAFTVEEFTLPRQSKVAFHRNTLIRRDDSSQNLEIRQKTKQQLQDRLADDGLEFVDVEQAEYLLVATLVLGDALSNAEITQRFGLTPSLVPPNRRYEAGTLILGIFKKGENQFLWRGSVQTITKSTNNPALVNEHQEKAVDRLVRRFRRDVLR